MEHTREIKFRAKRIDNHPVFWAYGYFVKTPITAEFNAVQGQFFDSGHVGRYCIVTDTGVAHEIDVNTVCRYTGLKDKNGAEIYQGDLIEEQTIHRVFVIQWSDAEARFNMMFLYGENGYPGQLRHIVDIRNMKRIGNIYENRELLKQL